MLAQIAKAVGRIWPSLSGQWQKCISWVKDNFVVSCHLMICKFVVYQNICVQCSGLRSSCFVSQSLKHSHCHPPALQLVGPLGVWSCFTFETKFWTGTFCCWHEVISLDGDTAHHHFKMYIRYQFLLLKPRGHIAFPRQAILLPRILNLRLINHVIIQIW